jgi:NAD(P)-dependent dehydrogenase (short-subunit alcohol dehydrogenase family)
MSSSDTGEPSSAGLLEGHVAIITGAGAGIGKAVVELFTAEGARCIAIDRDEARLKAFGSDILSVVGSVDDLVTNQAAVDLAQAEYGRLDSFVCVAGIWDFYKRATKLSASELSAAFDEIMSVNVKSTLLAAGAAAPALKASNGTLILTGSNASFSAGGGGALYTASKFAVRGLVYQLAAELAPDVRVNGVAPGGTVTSLSGAVSLSQDTRDLGKDDRMLGAVQSASPLGAADPADHAGIYLTLASRKLSPKTTGTLFVSDSGLSVR